MSDSSPRFVFLDALRGFAALGVLLCHLPGWSVMGLVFSRVPPKPVLVVLEHCALGVNIFFVLSGFVIAHSLRNNPLSFSSLARFIGRRHIRLDLPYWTIIALGIGVIALKRVLPGTHFYAFPPVDVLAANLVYAQFIFDRPPLLGISWTLCLEVQFYLLFVLILVVGRRIAPHAPSSVPTATSGAVVLVAVLAVGCLLGNHFSLHPAFFWSSWQFFGSGVLLYWTWQKVLSPRWFWAMIGVLIADAGLVLIVRAPTVMFQLNSVAALVATASTLGAIYFVARRGALEKWSGGRVFEFLGRISYSLYLTHLLVLDLALRTALHLTGSNPFMVWVWFLVVSALCLGVAALFHLCVELPAMKLANRFKIREVAPSLSPMR